MMFELNGLSNIVNKDDKDLTVFYNVGTLAQLELELIEEDTIDSIKELEMTTILDSFISTEHQTREIKAKINEIIRKVNELDKQLKENMQ